MAERTIVQYGVYQFDEQEKRAYRLRLMGQVLRHPNTEYQNLKYQKYKGFYGYAQLMNGDFVHQVIPIEFEKQCIFEYFAHDNLNSLYNSALQLGVIRTISNAVEQLGGSGLLIVGSTLPFFPMPYDRVVVKLHSNTTLLLFTEIITLPDIPEVPQQFDDGTATPTPSSGATAEPNPLDEPYDIPTAPYDDATDDNGETYSPEVPEEGEGTPGNRYRLYFQIRQSSTDATLVGGYESVYAPYSAPYCRQEGSGWRCYVRNTSTNAETYLGGASVECYLVITAVEAL